MIDTSYNQVFRQTFSIKKNLYAGAKLGFLFKGPSGQIAALIYLSRQPPTHTYTYTHFFIIYTHIYAHTFLFDKLYIYTHPKKKKKKKRA